MVRIHTGLTAYPPTRIDYSCEHVIYHFKKDGVLEITGDTERYKSGTFKYEFSHSPLQDYDTSEPYFVKINNLKKPCNIIDNGRQMYLNTGYLDGPTEIFIRIK